MRTLERGVFLLSIIFAFTLINAQPRQSSAADAGQSSPEASAKSESTALAALEPIDTHTHVMTKGDPAFFAMLDQLHMHVLDILLVDDHDDYRKDLKTELEDAWAPFPRVMAMRPCAPALILSSSITQTFQLQPSAT
jgi:hypothetical protein